MLSRTRWAPWVNTLAVALLVGACTTDQLDTGPVVQSDTDKTSDVDNVVGVDGSEEEVTGECPEPPCVECKESADCDDAFADLGPCEVALCVDDMCTRRPKIEGAPCEDGDPCTLGDHCTVAAGGRLDCRAGSGGCSDDDVCNGEEACDPTEGCIEGEPLECDDSDACTTDTCDPVNGCVHGPSGVEGCCSGDADCDDQNTCTDDRCNVDGFSCVNEAIDGDCDDGDACTAEDTCDAGICVGAKTVDCDDRQPCTVDSCDAETGCMNRPSDGPCDDGNACTTEDSCVEGRCVGGPPPDCDDQNDCTADPCDISSGCVHEAVEGPCEDGDRCTEADTCEGRRCVAGNTVDCDDRDPCTIDGCDPETGCTHAPSDVGCEDGDPCTSGDTCVGGKCVGGEPTDCDDGKPCTDDDCDPGIGCTHEERSGDCEDGEPCTDGDQCEGGECVGGDPTDCDDDNVCTDDSCVDGVGCSNAPVEGSCDDGDLCTDRDFCKEGVCTGGPPTDCDDNNVCTDDTCTSDSGCASAPVPGPCNDLNPCTDTDTCQDGTCSGSPVPGCHIVCELAGDRGDVIECPIGLARVGEEGPAATEISFRIEYPSGTAELETLVDEECGGGACIDSRIPQDSAQLRPSGHDVALSPARAVEWFGTVELRVAHSLWPDRSINDAYVVGGQVRGSDASLLRLRFELRSRAAKSYALLRNITAKSAGGETLATDFSKSLILTGEAPCSGGVCFDGKACTTDECIDGQCVFTPQTGSCDDGNACTANDTCDQEGNCLPGPPAGQGKPCTGADKCAEVGTCDGQGTCVIVPGMAVVCEEPEHGCQAAACDPRSGTCVYSPRPGIGCDDGDACTEDDTCDARGLCSGTAVDCSDPFGCTIESCHRDMGCQHFTAHGLCDDRNPCTEDSCDPKVGCRHDPRSGSCEDGNLCTTLDSCVDGQCVGTNDPRCACSSDAECDILEAEDGNVCNGIFECRGGVCSIDPATMIMCPPDGYQCKEGWTCDKLTGECSGQPKSCDDGLACTADSCSPTFGCKHEYISLCPVANICSLTGGTGEEVECVVRLARESAGQPVPSGGTLRLHWDKSRLRLKNLSDEFCIGSSCIPFDMVTCNSEGKQCTHEKLRPSRHDLLLAPRNVADWKDWVSMLMFHASEPNEPLSTAVLAPDGSVGDESEILVLRFELVSEALSFDPAEVAVGQVFFNPSSGLPMRVFVREHPEGTVFVVRAER